MYVEHLMELGFSVRPRHVGTLAMNHDQEGYGHTTKSVRQHTKQNNLNKNQSFTVAVCGVAALLLFVVRAQEEVATQALITHDGDIEAAANALMD